MNLDRLDNEIEDDEFVGFLTDMEKFKIIEELSDEILISVVKDQINNINLDSYQRNNHLDIFEKRYQNVVNYYKNNDILIEELNNVRDDYYGQIEKELNKVFGIYIDEELTDRYLIIKALYSHFVLNNKAVYINFLLKFIEDNRQSLINIKETSKSVEAFILKKKYKNKELINLLSNLYPIVDYILELELEPSLILKNTFEEGEVNSFIIHNNLSKIHLADDFSEKFLNCIKKNRNNYFIVVTNLLQILKQRYQLELNVREGVVL